MKNPTAAQKTNAAEILRRAGLDSDAVDMTLDALSETEKSCSTTDIADDASRSYDSDGDEINDEDIEAAVYEAAVVMGRSRR